MKIRVYFCKEPDPESLFKDDKISRQALETIYDLVWESEFKNIVNVGKVWLKFNEDLKPFGIPLEKKRRHKRMSAGDIIQMGKEFYMVKQIGVKKINLL
jgi:hypothetical protein